MSKKLGKQKGYVVEKYTRPTGAEINAKYVQFEKDISEDLDGLYGTSFKEMSAVMQNPEAYSNEEITRIFYGKAL